MTKRNQPTKVVLTMRRKDIRKRKGIRYAEYYNMVEIQDELYRQGMMKKKFYHLMPIIASPQNIRLAYRNLKNNKGSNTPGVDGKTFADYAKLEDVELIRKVQEKLLNYQLRTDRHTTSTDGSDGPAFNHNLGSLQAACLTASQAQTGNRGDRGERFATKTERRYLFEIV